MSVQKSIAVIAIIALLLCDFAYARTINVAGEWGFVMDGWPNGDKFKAGDVLEFIYNTEFHDVWIVNEQNYKSCNASGTRLYSGHDFVILSRGTSYFICGFPGHCKSGIKAEVIAE